MDRSMIKNIIVKLIPIAETILLVFLSLLLMKLVISQRDLILIIPFVVIISSFIAHKRTLISQLSSIFHITR